MSCRYFVGNHSRVVQRALKKFGLNFGVAFQIIDDCKDFLSEESELGKCPGQDIIAADITLPLLTLSEVVGQAEREELRNMLGSETIDNNLAQLKTMLLNSNVLPNIHEVVKSYLSTAQRYLDLLADSFYKESLSRLVDYTTWMAS